MLSALFARVLLDVIVHGGNGCGSAIWRLHKLRDAKRGAEEGRRKVFATTYRILDGLAIVKAFEHARQFFSTFAYFLCFLDAAWMWFCDCACAGKIGSLFVFDGCHGGMEERG